KAAMQGIELPQEDEEQLTIEKVEEHLVNYTSLEERWGNKVLESCKVEFNMKELSEEGFRDLIIGAREYFHIYEDNSRMGFNVEVANGKFVWVLKSQDKKYTSDAQNSGKGAYAAGLLRVMEISEIIQRFNLTKEEIDHLREYTKDFPDIGNRP